MANWRVLIVDDEPDVHAVTDLALKFKKWRNKRFELVRAFSAGEAREILNKPENNFQVAMIDVVMETDDAGLRLCEYIRESQPRSLRIILRTGQANVAPEERVLNEYDIDHYLAKSEATPERLFAVVRASLRASMDVDTFIALKSQLAKLVSCFKNPTTPKGLAQEMQHFVGRLEEKYSSKMSFFANAHTDTDGSELFRQAVLRAIATNKWGQYVAGETVGLDGQHLVVPFAVDVTGAGSPKRAIHGLRRVLRNVLGEPPTSAAMQPIEGGLVVAFGAGITALETRDCLHEFNLALEQWKLVYGVLCVQQDVAFQRVFEERARRARIDALGK
jgi:CheY-like chemotaxis protein